ncbi:hypothetical protein AGMMS49965_05390 [Bacteroidia bacterium]|nr:hypothetical protein AGMMS49965_05390 [Bacteroidia bacterium]
MGRITQGILGGFSGKVGDFVGASWRGINYMRAFPQHIHNPQSEKQVAQRTKFKVTIQFLRPLNDFLRTGFKMYAQNRSPLNAATSYTLTNAIKGTSSLNYAVDQTKVLVSRGELTPAANAEANTGPNDFQVNFHWSNNSGTGSATSTDKALLLLLNPAKAEAFSVTDGNPRSEEGQEIFAPADWLGDAVYAYLGFISQNGTEVANSVYLGTCEIRKSSTCGKHQYHKNS